MAYVPPSPSAVDFDLKPYTAPLASAVNFDLESSQGGLVAESVVSGKASLPSFVIGQTHSIAISSLSSGSASLGSVVLTQRHAVSAQSVSSGSSSLPSPAVAQMFVLSASSLASQSAQLGSPSVAVLSALLADSIQSGSPSLGDPSVSQVFNLSASALVSGKSDIPFITIQQSHAVLSFNLSSGAPILGAPSIIEKTPEILADSLYAGSATLDSTSIMQEHGIQVAHLVSGQASLNPALIQQVYELYVDSIDSEPPEIGTFRIEQIYRFNLLRGPLRRYEVAAALLDINIYKGATFRRKFTLTMPNPDPVDALVNPRIPVNLTGYTFRAGIKPETNDKAVPTAVFSCVLDPHPETGKFTMTMPSEITESIPSAGKNWEQFQRYTWDLELIAPSGAVTRLFHGFALVSPRTSKGVVNV